MAKEKLIGISISEAIDWTQDKLASTRPIAESVLFSMIADKKIEEYEEGFVLHESENEDDDDKDMLKRKAHRMSRINQHRIRFKMGPKKRPFQERREILRKRLHEMGYTETGEETEENEKHGRLPTEKKPLPASWVPSGRG